MSKIIVLSGLPGSGKSTFRNAIKQYMNIKELDNVDLRKHMFQLKEVKINNKWYLYGLKDEYILILHINNFGFDDSFLNDFKKYIEKYNISISRLKDYIHRIKTNTNNKKPYIQELENMLKAKNIDNATFINIINKIENIIKILPEEIKYTVYSKLPMGRHKEIWDWHYIFLENYIINNENIILESINFFPKYYKVIYNMIHKLNKNYDIYIVHWWNLSLKEAKKRNKLRKDYQIIPDETIEQMFQNIKNIENALKNELNFIKPNHVFNLSNLEKKEYFEIAKVLSNC